MIRPRLCVVFVLLGLTGCGREAVVRIGSKSFTESVILGEMARQLCLSAGIPARHRARLGDTSKAWTALEVGELDAYVEYTGTLIHEILAEEDVSTPERLRAALERRGLRMSTSLGFRNNYALGMTTELADGRGVRRISDLRGHPGLRLGLSHAFIERSDGWRGLKQRYQLPFATPPGMEHTLAYRGLESGALDVIDLYTTDAEIVRYNLRVLEDDRNYFPAYEAVLLYRADLEHRFPDAIPAMLRLQGALNEKTMQNLNARANIDHEPEAVVARDFLAERFGLRVQIEVETRTDRLLRATRQHLLLVGVSLFFAILVAIPLGILASMHPLAGQGILAAVSIVQTIPALALLSLLIILLKRIGTAPALVALFVYSLLPIVRNTCTGLQDIPLSIRESAGALGLSTLARLRLIDLPMASRSILAGIKTAAVINVGFATLGGLIGAGGYGQAIISGLDKNDYRLILEGAAPAVVLALVVQGLFELSEKWLVPRGLRLRPAE